MNAFHSNLLVRVATNDDFAQVAAVRQLIDLHVVFISRTVLLETEWVLRASYRQSKEAIHGFMRALLQTENTVIEDHERVEQALSWYYLGADFADALHLAACGTAPLHTFDRGFCKAAREQGIAPAVRILEI